jgi:diguanylate cyclase (GGDEF)-like protein
MRWFWKSARRRVAREQTIIASLIVAYVLTGKLGLVLAYDHPATSLVWPPAGIALGAFVVLGYRVWPAVLAAATILYAITIGAVPAVVAMAAGNTLEGVLTAYLINRFAGGRNAIQNPGNAFRFAGLVILASMTIGGTIGAASLSISGLASWMDYGKIWMTWSLGNMTGSLLLAPTIMLWSQGGNERWPTARTVEAVLVLLTIVFVGLAVFCGFPSELRGYPIEFLCVPVLLWPAFRLGRRATAVAILLLTSLALFGTLSGYGVFVRSTPTASLIMVQTFMSITAVMTMALSALASEYSVAEAQLRELVVTDPLTGLPNYRRLVEVLGNEIARSNRNDEPFAVAFFDMDGLKRINDELGHLIGSRAVCRFAETLRASCRATDTAARYGGDEFVVILPDTDDEGARVVIQRVEERLAEDPDKPELAVSAGVAVYPRDGGTPTTLLSAADRALYAVKASKANARRRGVVALHEWSSAAGSR